MTKEEVLEKTMEQFCNVLLAIEHRFNEKFEFKVEAELHDGRVFQLALGDKE